VSNAVVKVTDTPVDAMTTLMPAASDKPSITTLRYYEFLYRLCAG
jgi:hypothetical protein